MCLNVCDRFNFNFFFLNLVGLFIRFYKIKKEKEGWEEL